MLFRSHARAGKLRLIAAATSERIPALPNLPTVAESGAPGYEAGTWFGMMGPPGMPREVTMKVSADAKRVLDNAAFRDQYVTRQWFEAVGNTPDQFAEYLRTEYDRWGRLIKLSGVTVDQ